MHLFVLNFKHCIMCFFVSCKKKSLLIYSYLFFSKFRHMNNKGILCVNNIIAFTLGMFLYLRCTITLANEWDRGERNGPMEKQGAGTKIYRTTLSLREEAEAFTKQHSRLYSFVEGWVFHRQTLKLTCKNVAWRVFLQFKHHIF